MVSNLMELLWLINCLRLFLVSALHMASGGGYTDCVQALLYDYNAIDSKDDSGQTALDLARNEAIAELIRTCTNNSRHD